MKKIVFSVFAIAVLLLPTLGSGTASAEALPLTQTATVGNVTFLYPEGWTLLENERGQAIVVKTVYYNKNRSSGVDGTKSVYKGDGSFVILDFPTADEQEGGSGPAAANLMVYGMHVQKGDFAKADDVRRAPENALFDLSVDVFSTFRLPSGDTVTQYRYTTRKYGYDRGNEYYVYDDRNIKYQGRYLKFGFWGIVGTKELPTSELKILEDTYDAIVYSAKYNNK